MYVLVTDALFEAHLLDMVRQASKIGLSVFHFCSQSFEEV